VARGQTHRFSKDDGNNTISPEVVSRATCDGRIPTRAVLSLAVRLGEGDAELGTAFVRENLKGGSKRCLSPFVM
jgi:hypothetical protein